MPSLLGGVEAWAWAAFTAAILALVVLDVLTMQRRGQAIPVREAAVRSLAWMGAAGAFCALLALTMGREEALTFLAGYVVEQSLSVDNMFVFVLVFAAFAVPAGLQARVLSWGILGAMILRGVMILAGAAVVQRFEWVLYLFGAFLVITGIRLGVHAWRGIGQEPPESAMDMPVVRFARRILPVHADFDGAKFLTRADGRWLATPLLLVLVVVEVSDVIFAVDSIPAIFAITTHPFLVFTSNVLAILNLRSIYFLLAGAMDRFHYLHAALAVILAFAGLKMLVKPWLPLSTEVALAVIACCLLAAVLASLVRERHRGGSGLSGAA